MTRYELLKFIHILFAVVWVGGGLLALVLATRAQKASQAHREGLAHDMEFVAKRIFAPASIVTLLFGILMVLDTDAFSFGDTWILIGLGGILFSIVLGIGVLTPLTGKINAELQAGRDGVGLLGRLTRIAALDSVVLLVVVWAMVAKPGL